MIGNSQAARKASFLFLGALAGIALAGTAIPMVLAIGVPEGFYLPVSLALVIASTVAGAYVALTCLDRIAPASTSTTNEKVATSCVLDTSAIIDGRIADVAATGILRGPLIVPGFVIAELQGIADSSDRLRRARGRRGLDVLNRLRSISDPPLVIDEREPAEGDSQPVDQKLVLVARELKACIVTGDFNLNKVAQLHGVNVVNLNDLAIALRPQCLPGETLDIRLVKAGEEPGQAVGYLDDGTMVVVEGAADRVNQQVKATVTSVLQTSAGRMIFAR